MIITIFRENFVKSVSRIFFFKKSISQNKFREINFTKNFLMKIKYFFTEIRSRSLSVSRSTQTREELEHFREMKKIKFTVHQCDAVDDREVKEELNECTSGTGDGSSITTNNILKVPNNTDL